MIFNEFVNRRALVANVEADDLGAFVFARILAHFISVPGATLRRVIHSLILTDRAQKTPTAVDRGTVRVKV